MVVVIGVVDCVGKSLFLSVNVTNLAADKWVQNVCTSEDKSDYMSPVGLGAKDGVGITTVILWKVFPVPIPPRPHRLCTAFQHSFTHIIFP